MASVEADLYDRVVAAASGASSANVFEGPMRKAGNGVPHQAIFIANTGGYEPQEYMDGGSPLLPKRAAIFVRSNPKDYSGGRSLAAAVFTAVHKCDISGYVRVVALNAEPVYLGVDDTEHHEWAFDVSAWAQ